MSRLTKQQRDTLRQLFRQARRSDKAESRQEAQSILRDILIDHGIEPGVHVSYISGGRARGHKVKKCTVLAIGTYVVVSAGTTMQRGVPAQLAIRFDPIDALEELTVR